MYDTTARERLRNNCETLVRAVSDVARYAATWMSQRDFARLVRAIIARDVPYAVVYGVGDNATRFWDLEPGRAIFGFWPEDGTK